MPAALKVVITAVVAAVLTGAIAVLPATSQADDFHSKDFRFGQRAMAMGGAVTGAVTGPTATLYNPAGLGFLHGSLFSGSMQYFGRDRRTLHDALRSAPIGMKTLTSDSFLATPTSSVITHAFRGGRHNIAYSTFVVTAVDEHFSGKLSQSYTTPSFRHEDTVTASWRTRDKIMYMGPSYAYRPKKTLSFGVSLFYVRREQTLDFNSEAQTDEFDVATDLFYRSLFDDQASSVTLNDGALVARLGVMWLPRPRWSVGFAVRTRSVSLHGKGSERLKYTTSGDALVDPPASPDRFSYSEAMMNVLTVYPWSLSVGAGYRASPTLLLTFGADLDLPVRYDRYERDAHAEPARSSVQTIARQTNWNVAAGAEWLITSSIPLRAGLFTNRSAAPAVPLTSIGRAPAQVHRYGVTASAGFVGDKRSFNIGAEYAWGSGYDSVAAESASYRAEYVRTPRSESRFVLFLSGAISFVKTTATDVIKHKLDEPTPAPGAATPTGAPAAAATSAGTEAGGVKPAPAKPAPAPPAGHKTGRDKAVIRRDAGE